MSARRSSAALCLLLSLFGCTTFPVIATDVCGNKVIEDNEDCDTYAEKGKVCRAPGTVDECHFDCRLNADNTRAECPTGTGCAADGICRKPTGNFESAMNFAPGVSSWLSTADFDGDGRLDVISGDATDELQQARFRIHYFDVDSKLEETRTFPRVVTRPIARQLTLAQDDQADDLIFSNDTIGMVPGRADREWVPATFSSYVLPGTRLLAAPVRGEGVGAGIGLAVFTSLEAGPGVYVPALDGASKLSLLSRLTRPFEDLAGQPISAELVTGADSPCSEVVFAFLGDDSVHVLDLCEPGTDTFGLEVLWRTTAREQVVHLPGGAPVSAAPLTADVDGDGHLDILVGSEGRTFFARGDGAMLESEASLLMLSPLEKDPMGKSDPFPVATPLAAGDITGDGDVDFVLPTGILASHHSFVDGRLGYKESYHNRAQPWSMAQMIDLNANGLPDVIAGTQGAPGLTFLSGTAGFAQVATRLATQGPVRFLSTGDFDGDRVSDVAFVQGGPPQSGVDSLAIAFGRRDGVPEAGRSIAELDGVQQLGRADQAGIDSVFVVSQDRLRGETRSQFTLFDGSPDRLPFAPYSLVTFSVDGSLHDSLARVLASGSFTALGANDLIVMGGELPPPGEQADVTKWSLWLVPDIGGGQEPPRRLLLDAVPPDAVPVTINREGGQLSATAAAADLEGDGFDEALLLMPVWDKAQPDLTKTAVGCVLLIYDVDGATNTATSKGVLRFDEHCPLPELSTVDLDGDDAPDLLMLIGDPERQARRLEILWNDGKGGFSADNRSIIADENGRDIRAFSVFPTAKLDDDGCLAPPRLAIVTDQWLQLASRTVDVGRRCRHRGRGEFDHLVAAQEFHDAHSVVVTDPNGDSIPDIAVADAAGVWLVGAQLR